MLENTRFSPEPHRYAVCAYQDMPIKEFYKDYYDEVFIFFHPFAQSLVPNLDLIEGQLYKFEWMKQTRLVRWEEVIKLLGMKDYKELDVALRSSIHGLGIEFVDKAAGEKVVDLRGKKGVYQPSEGILPSELVNPLLEAIKSEGHDWIWIGDEFGTERRLEDVGGLLESNQLDIGRNNLFMRNTGRYNLFTHNYELLVTTHWDSHFSMLCSDKETVERIVKQCDLEGFYCDEKTEIHWSLRN